MLIGWLGTACIVSAYALVSTGRLNGRSVLYQVLNLAGAIMLGVDVWIAGSAPAFALQVVWGVIALVALVGILKSSHKRVNK